MKYLIFFLAVCPFFLTAQNCFFNDGGEAFTNGGQAFTDGQTCEKKQTVLYPNPTQDVFYLSETGQNTEGVVVNSIGQIVQKISLKTQPFYVGDLATGVYFLVLLPSKTNLKFVKL